MVNVEPIPAPVIETLPEPEPVKVVKKRTKKVAPVVAPAPAKKVRKKKVK